MSTTLEQKNLSQSKPKLSASKLKTLSNCSWLYYCEYVLKLPKESNSGAKRGTVSHTVFEVLLSPRHKKHFQAIIDANSIDASPSIKRLVTKNAKALGVHTPEDMALIYSMVITGLKNDFFCEGCVELQAEEEFKLESDSFIINGFIDKKAKYPDGTVRIFDYKTSKKIFTKAEIEYNLQNLMYSLACYKTEGVIPKVTFLFLRFPKKPAQDAPVCTEHQLMGFEAYLSHIAKLIKDFSIKDAKKDFAADNKEKRWLCGRNQFRGQLKEDNTPVWGCSCKFGFDYYVKIDKDKKIIQSSFMRSDLTPEDGCEILKKIYSGCPAFKNNKNITDF